MLISIHFERASNSNTHQPAAVSPFSSNHGSPLPAPSQTAITYSLGHMGAGNNAIAAAASQAIAATQQVLSSYSYAISCVVRKLFMEC